VRVTSSGRNVSPKSEVMVMSVFRVFLSTRGGLRKRMYRILGPRRWKTAFKIKEQQGKARHKRQQTIELFNAWQLFGRVSSCFNPEF